MYAQVRAYPGAERAIAGAVHNGSIARLSRGPRFARRFRVLNEVAERGGECRVAVSRRVLVAERGLGRRVSHAVHQLAIVTIQRSARNLCTRRRTAVVARVVWSRLMLDELAPVVG
jgi:hypothetical protein